MWWELAAEASEEYVGREILERASHCCTGLQPACLKLQHHLTGNLKWWNRTGCLLWGRVTSFPCSAQCYLRSCHLAACSEVSRISGAERKRPRALGLIFDDASTHCHKDAEVERREDSKLWTWSDFVLAGWGQQQRGKVKRECSHLILVWSTQWKS